jgi:hypothetical protein
VVALCSDLLFAIVAIGGGNFIRPEGRRHDSHRDLDRSAPLVRAIGYTFQQKFVLSGIACRSARAFG